MTEYTEALIHIPLQYFNDIKNIKICLFESQNNLYKHLSLYNNNITHNHFIKNLDDFYDLIILENNFNISINDINNFIENSKILMVPERISTYWDYIFKLIDFKSDDIKAKYKYKIKIGDIIVNYYSNTIDALNYFVNFKNYNILVDKPKYYKPENHFKYFIEYDKTNHNFIMGAHIMLDFDNVDFDLLEDTIYIKKLMNDIAIEEKFVVLHKVYHKFDPQGFTLLFLLSTSHFSIHTYPEYNKCSIDLYSCDMNVDYNNVINKLKSGLKSDNFKLHQVIRKI
jgi:S-adenosylmethionine decarboxylase